MLESYTIKDYYEEIKEFVNKMDFEDPDVKNSILSALNAKIGTDVIFKKDETDGTHPVHFYCGQCGHQLLYTNYIHRFPQGSMVKKVFHYRCCPSCGYAINYDDMRKED